MRFGGPASPVWYAPSILRLSPSQIAFAAPLQETTDKEIQDATRKRGFSSPTAFIRHSGGTVGVWRGTCRRRRTTRGQHRAGQAGSLPIRTSPAGPCSRSWTGCADVRSRARRGRRWKLKSAGQAMVGDSRLAMQDLVNRGEGWVTNASSGFDRGSRLPGMNGWAWASAYKILMHHARMSGSWKSRSLDSARARSALGLTTNGVLCGHVREEHRCRTVASPRP